MPLFMRKEFRKATRLIYSKMRIKPTWKTCYIIFKIYEINPMKFCSPSAACTFVCLIGYLFDNHFILSTHPPPPHTLCYKYSVRIRIMYLQCPTLFLANVQKRGINIVRNINSPFGLKMHTPKQPLQTVAKKQA